MGSNLDHEIFLQQGDVVERAIELPGPQDRAGSGIDQLRGDAEILAHSADIAFEQVVMELAGSPFHTATPLHAVRVLLQRRCAIGGSTDPGQRLRLLHSEVVARGLDPVSLVPLLASVLGLDSQTDFDPTSAEWSERDEQVLSAVRTYLLACVSGGKGLIIAEDVQWCDPTTIEVLDTLLNAPPHRLLVVMTARTGTWLPAGWPVDVLDLHPLTDKQANETH